MKAKKETQFGQFELRTDLALEERERFPGDGGEVFGVSLEKWENKQEKIRFTEVKILNQDGAKAMGKPVGTYLTIEADDLSDQDEAYHQEVAEELARQIEKLAKELLKNQPEYKRESKLMCRVLVAGLGNQSVTPDALGPRVFQKLEITRHLTLEYGADFCEKRSLPVLSGIAPGVMAQTGMESAEILKGIIEETAPQLLIAVDALAARSVKRLGTTIQLTDTGIQPGSGVGNHRNSLTRESLGIPVIAIGVPTVVGAAAIVHHTVSAMIRLLASSEGTGGMAEFVEKMDPDGQYQLIRELLEPEFGPMYVTTPDIDETIQQLSSIISQGIRQAFL